MSLNGAQIKKENNAGTGDLCLVYSPVGPLSAFLWIRNVLLKYLFEGDQLI